MFQGSEQSFDVGASSHPVIDSGGAPSPAAGMVAHYTAPGRYGGGRTLNLPAAIVVALLHVVIIGAIIQARTVYVQKKQESLAVINLTPPSPPPPAADTPPPPPKTPVAVPPPIVALPAPPPPMAVAPVAPVTPVAPVAVAAAPVSFAPPAASSMVQANDLMARMVEGKAPTYPIESRRKREEGKVVLSVTIGLDGRVEAISVAVSSGFDRLDNAAMKAVRQWRWTPMMRDGAPIRVRGNVPIPFVIKA